VKRRLAIAITTATALVILDLITKRQASISFVGAETSVIPGVLSFTFIENAGSAFSLFRSGGAIFAIAAVLATVAVLVTLRNPHTDLETIAFGLIMGGAIGNFVDRVARGTGLLDGTVIDWIRFPNFPVFNLADSGLTIGVALLFVAMWRQRGETA